MSKYLLLFIFSIIDFKNVSVFGQLYYTEEVDIEVLETMFWRQWYKRSNETPFDKELEKLKDNNNIKPVTGIHKKNVESLMRLFLDSQVRTSGDLYTLKVKLASQVAEFKNELPTPHRLKLHLKEMDEKCIIILDVIVMIMEQPQPTPVLKGQQEIKLTGTTRQYWMIVVPSYGEDNQTIMGYFLVRYSDPVIYTTNEGLQSGGTIVAFANHEKKYIYHRKTSTRPSTDFKQLTHFTEKSDKLEEQNEIQDRLKLKDVEPTVDYLMKKYGPKGDEDVELEPSVGSGL